ncbi:MAG TPA: M12 family metallo-peptidase [Pyrinomonadaceae bacterium]|nr:M12 family metallo-peptidase [Pyrinomonadaceae bacterium]
MLRRNLYRRVRLRRATVTALLLCLLALPLASQSLTGASRQDAPTPDISKIFKSHEVVKLDTRRSAEQVRREGRLSLVTADETLELSLEPHDMRAEGYRAEEVGADGVRRAVASGEVRTFRGEVRGREGAQARLTVDDAVIEGVILLDGEKRFIEPLNRYSKASSAQEFVLYKESDVIQNRPDSCGVTTMVDKVERAAQTVSSQAPDAAERLSAAAATLPLNREIELATEADYEFVSTAGGSSAANAEILSLLNLVDGVYQNDLGISFSVVYQHTWATPEDPYTTADSSALLREFQGYWNSNQTAVSRDLAHLWTGRDLNGDIIGTAFIASLCQTPLRAYGLSQRVSDISIKIDLTAHEIGHNLGASHPDQETPAVTACVNTIMQSRVGSSRSFCQFSRDQIADYVNNNAASCLTPTFSISGQISGTFDNTTTLLVSGTKTKTVQVVDSRGSYTIRGLTPGTYTITPTKPFHTYSPQSRTIADLSADVTGVDFTGSLVGYSISGRIADANDNGVAGITVRVSTAAGIVGSDDTDASGNYSVEGIPATRDYSVSAFSPLYFISPVSTTITNLTADRTGINFTAVPRVAPTPTPTPAPTPVPVPELSGKILFESTFQDNRGLYTIDADGRNAAILTNSFDATPEWSPDGTKIAFYRAGNIHIMNADGSNPRRLTTSMVLESGPSWSPDGTKVIFNISENIMVANVEGVASEPTKLTTLKGFQPRLSPDGTKLVFVDNNRFDLGQIWVANVDGTGLVQLTNSTEKSSTPTWSPDGRRILFLRGSGLAQIYVMNADGSNQTALTPVGDYATPSWSPDGTKIVYAKGSHIYIARADGSNQTQVTNNGRSNHYPRWKATPGAPTPSPVASVTLIQSAYTYTELAELATITVARLGDISQPARVNYATSDAAGLSPCTLAAGKASERCDYATSVGTLRWAAGEGASKTFTIPLVNDQHAEGSETFNVTLSAPSGVSLGEIASATITIQDDANDALGGSNPIEAVRFYISQQYIDFLGRLPDENGLLNWTSTLSTCPGGGFGTNNPTCDRIHIAKSTFQSEEFQTRGYWAYRFYEVAFGRRPTYAEFTPDMAAVGGSRSPAEEALSKAQYTTEFVLRQEFVQKYGATTDPAQYVDALLASAGVPTLPTRSALIEALRAGQKTREQVLREIVESTEVEARFYTRGFVSMMYYGFLRRDPDTVGFDNYVRKLETFWDPRAVTFDFIYSTEYLGRFGKP